MAKKFILDEPAVLVAYHSGLTTPELGRQLGCSYMTIWRCLKRVGAPIRRSGPHRTYRLNETFFDEIDTEEKAYWLGFLLADGCVRQTKNRGWRISCALATKDREHLVRLAKALETDSPVRRAKGGKSYCLTLWSATLARGLISQGCIPRKTCVHGTPKLSRWLQHHFYRGFTDGDGSFYQEARSAHWNYSILGSPEFIRDYQRWLMRRVGVRATKLDEHTRCPLLIMKYGGGCQVQAIGDHLYENATIYLPRKYELYQQISKRNTVPGDPPLDLPITAIIVGYRLGGTLHELGRQYGCSYMTIWKRLKDAGEPRRRSGPPLKTAG